MLISLVTPNKHYPVTAGQCYKYAFQMHNLSPYHLLIQVFILYVSLLCMVIILSYMLSFGISYSRRVGLRHAIIATKLPSVI